MFKLVTVVMVVWLIEEKLVYQWEDHLVVMVVKEQILSLKLMKD